MTDESTMHPWSRRRFIGRSAAVAALPLVRPLAARAAADPVTLTMWSWVPHLRTELDMFEAANPGIRITVTNAGQAGPEYAKLRTALKAGTGAPDIVQLELSMVRSFAQTSGLTDLAPYGAATMSRDYVPYAWQQATEGKRVHALPWDSGPMGQIYREDIASATGFTPPKTWAEFSDTALRVAKSSKDVLLTNATFSDGGWITGLLWQAGWRPFTVDGDRIAIRIKDDVSARFAAYWQKLIDAKAVDTAPGFTTDWYQSLARGRYAIWLTAAWGPLFLSQFAGASSGKWRVAGIPQWDAAKPSNGNYGGSTLAVPATSPHKAAAAKAVMWLLGQRAPGEAFATTQFLFPVLNSLLDEPRFLRTPYPFYGNQPINTVFAEASRQVGTDFQWCPFNDYFIAQLGNECGAAAGGGGSLDAAFDRLQTRITRFARQQGFTVTS
ncbi:ABC transporter substrate-binding protein [Lichenicoccus sp.]|uniref:ABC transporter substrate-binding protein n=1 Tax=Lichenicoccus sp. TaxID=2781899 RepID=UPI003D0E862A